MKQLLLLIGALLTLQSCISPVNETETPSVERDSSHIDLSDYPELNNLKLDSSFIITGGDSRVIAKTIDSLDMDYLIIVPTEEMVETALALASYRTINQADAVTAARVVVLDQIIGSYSGTTRDDFTNLLRDINRFRKSDKLLYIALISRPHEFNAVPLPFSEKDMYSDYNYTKQLETPLVIGRIPLASNLEGAEYLKKLVLTEPKLRREASFVADDRWIRGIMESLNHYKQVSRIADSLDIREWHSNVLGIHEFSDTLYDSLTPGPLTDNAVEKARDSIVDLFNATSGCITYMGHIGPHQWSDENIFPEEQIALLESNNILVGNTYAYDMRSGDRSLSEKMFLNENGIVASVSPSHTMSWAIQNEEFITTFYEKIESSSTLGEAYYKTMQTHDIDYYSIMGDPALSITGLHR